MSQYKRILSFGALCCVLAALPQQTALAQEGPMLHRVAMVKLKNGSQNDFEELSRMLNTAYKKAGVPARSVWRPVMFGEKMDYAVSVSPVKNFAQFDSEGPTAQMSPADRVKYANLARNCVESVSYSLDEMLPQLSISSQRTTPPKFARVTTLQVQPGKHLEFEEVIRSTVLPAMKKAGVKDYWVNRTMLGGPMGQYTILTLFDKWADLDSMPMLDKMLGADGFKQFLGKVAGTVAHGETTVVTYDQALSYRQ